MTTEQLRNIYADQLRRYIQARIQGPAAEDILQQVFLVAHEKHDMLREPDAVKSRLYRISHNMLIDRYRREYDGKEHQFDDSFRDRLDDSSGSSGQERLVRKVSSCLLPMIEDLDEVTRRVLKKYLDKDMSHQMIAEECGLTESNVKVIIHRAKKKLKQMYTTCCNQYRDEQGRIIDTWCRNNCGCDSV